MNNNFDDLLKQAVTEHTEEKLQSSLYREDEFEFSQDFEKKMDKMLKSEHNIYHKLTLTKARRVLCVAAIISAMLLASLSVEAVRNTIANFFVQIFGDHDTISANTEESTYPTKIEKLYELTALPKEYELLDEDITDDWASYIYSNNKYSLLFDQYTKDDYITNFDNENSNKITKTYNGQEYVIYIITDETADTVIAVWDNGEYVFQVTTFDVTTDTLIKWCDSLKLKE